MGLFSIRMKMEMSLIYRLILLAHVSHIYYSINHILKIEDTPFYKGCFRCKLVIDNEFPNKPPKGYFLTKIFHPNVNAVTGDICVNTLKRDWDPAKWSLSHIFQIIKCLLIVPFPESSLNEEAGRLFMESYEEFYQQAKLYTSIHA